MNGKAPLVSISTLLVLAAFGGCVQGEAKPQSVVPSSAAPGVVTATTGAIEGFLLDDEQIPVAGATIGIRIVGGKPLNQTTSAADGAFSFSGLEPGEYELAVQSPFFEPKTQKVTVPVGEVVQVKIAIQRVAAPVERLVEILIKKGYIACNVGWRNPTNPSTSGGNAITSNVCYGIQGDVSDFKVPINLELPFRELILELVWTPGTGFSGSRLRMDFCSEKPDENNYFAQCKIVSGSNPYSTSETGPSPLVLRRNDVPVDRISAFEATVGDGGYDLADPSTLRVPLTFQQPFDLYMSLCYYDNCTAEHQARPPA